MSQEDMIKGLIMEFLDWADINRAISLCRYDGYDEPTILYKTTPEDIIDEYLRSLRGAIND